MEVHKQRRINGHPLKVALHEAWKVRVALGDNVTESAIRSAYDEYRVAIASADEFEELLASRSDDCDTRVYTLDHLYNPFVMAFHAQLGIPGELNGRED